MLRFLLALIMTNAMVLAISLSTKWPYLSKYLNTAVVRDLILLVFVIPIAVSYLVALLYNVVRPRRMFVNRFVGFLPIFLIAALVTILSVLFISLGAVFAGRYLRDPYLVFISSIAAPILVLSLCRRPRPGFCQKCCYDLTASLPFGRCPECGTASMA